MMNKGPSEKKCGCNLCKRGRKFRSIINKLSEDDREWMEEFMNYHYLISADLEATKVYLRGMELKTGRRIGLGEALQLINRKITPTDEQDEIIRKELEHEQE